MTHLCTFHIAGNRFAPGSLRNLSAGDEIDIRPEPSNPHDDKALRCDYGGVKLGYVPRPVNEILDKMVEIFNCSLTMTVKEKGKGLVDVDLVQAEANEWETYPAPVDRAP